jgi:ZIP family zinc transporter
MPGLTFTSLAAISTLLGGWIALRGRRHIHLLLGFGAGVLLGATFFDLLPEAISAANGYGWTTRKELAMVIVGFFLFHLAERFLVLHACPTGDCEREVHRHLGRLSALGLIAHSIVDGASITAATLLSWHTGLIVALGIVAHDFSDGLNTMLLVTRGEPAGRKDYFFLVADAIAPVIGGIILVESKFSGQQLGIFLGLTAGFFLFTATGDLLPDAHRRSPSFAVTAAAVAGLAFIGGAVRLITTVW